MKTPIEYIKEAWKIYTDKKNFRFFARVMAIVTVLSGILSYVMGYFYPFKYPAQSIDYSNPRELGLFIILVVAISIIGLWGKSVGYMAVIKMGKDEKEILKLGYLKMWKFFLIMLVSGLIIVLGLVALIIPGIIFSVKYSMSPFLVMEKNLGVKAALSESSKMVKGIFWKVFGRFIVFGLFTMLISILVDLVPYGGGYLLTTFAAPFFLLPFYLLYKDVGLRNSGS